MFDRFRGTLNMPHNENNEHRCVACGQCQMACPNDTIKVTSETVETEDGKKKKILATYEYDLGACMFCQLCVNACPHDAITFDQNFEHAVFDRAKLVLNGTQKGVTQQKKDAGRAEEHEEQVGGRAYDTLGSHRHDGHSNNKCCQKVEYYCFKC